MPARFISVPLHSVGFEYMIVLKMPISIETSIYQKFIAECDRSLNKKSDFTSGSSFLLGIDYSSKLDLFQEYSSRLYKEYPVIHARLTPRRGKYISQFGLMCAPEYDRNPLLVNAFLSNTLCQSRKFLPNSSFRRRLHYQRYRNCSLCIYELSREKVSHLSKTYIGNGSCRGLEFRLHAENYFKCKKNDESSLFC